MKCENNKYFFSVPNFESFLMEILWSSSKLERHPAFLANRLHIQKLSMD